MCVCVCANKGQDIRAAQQFMTIKLKNISTEQRVISKEEEEKL